MMKLVPGVHYKMNKRTCAASKQNAWHFPYVATSNPPPSLSESHSEECEDVQLQLAREYAYWYMRH